MKDYEVTMIVTVKVYAEDEEDAKKQASRSTTNWDDWFYQETLNVTENS